MTALTDGQLAVLSDPRGISTPLTAGDAGNDGLRRSNSQFSDLTGRIETSPRTPRRSDLYDAQNGWLNAGGKVGA